MELEHQIHQSRLDHKAMVGVSPMHVYIYNNVSSLAYCNYNDQAMSSL